MRAYTDAGEEARRARDLLKDWHGEQLLSDAQYQRMEKETACDFRRTNIFLRVTLLFFTLIILAACTGLIFVTFQVSRSTAVGLLLLFQAAVSYGAAELAVSEWRLYRFGIEEALAACSVGFLCAALALLTQLNRPELLIAITCAAASLWLWRRFGFPYAFLVALIAAAFAAARLAPSPLASRLVTVVMCGAGLIALGAIRPFARNTYRNTEYSVAEALLWFGAYLTINLHSFLYDLPFQMMVGRLAYGEIPRPVYWATWGLTWCLPPLILARGVQMKDRLVIAAGTLAAIVTLITNRLYLGRPPHTWDPMLFGALLIAAAVLVRRWLDAAPDGVRHGFTAKRLSGKDKEWMNAAIGTIGVVSPQAVLPHATGQPDEFRFGGGDAGGGGASSDF